MIDKITLIKNKGYIPDTILDIGAYHGHWTDAMRKLFEYSKYYLFEAIDYPQLYKFDYVHNVKVFNLLLSDKIQDVDWYQMKNTGDSIYKEKTHYFNNCQVIKRRTIDLNTVFREKNILQDSKNIFIKIDCQGAEIPILKGATDIFDRTDFIVLEIPLFGQYNEGVPNFLEHIKYMDDIGFVPYDIADNHYTNNFNMQIDMIFINKNHPFNRIVNESLL
jgi:hypothetical protein